LVLIRWCSHISLLLQSLHLLPPPLVLADVATPAFFTLPPLLLVLAEAATDTVFARAPLVLVLAEAVAAVFSPSSHSLVLAEAAATVVPAYTFPPLV
jgi:hypothetical protein